MTALERIESFDPTKDIPEFLSNVREGYDEHYGRWFQDVGDDPMGSGRRFAYMRSGTCTNLKFSTNVSVPFLIYAVSSSCFHYFKIEALNLFSFLF